MASDPDKHDLQAILEDIHRDLSPRFGEGKVATYIPQLARVDPTHFGMAMVTVQGDVLRVGEADVPFSIQSISKVFLLALALGKHGEALWTHVGREPSGSAFNSIMLLEHEHGFPRNPFINAGAILVTDLVLAGHTPREAIGEMVRFIRFLAASDDIAIDEEVARSEAATGDRNLALAYFLRDYGRLKHPVEHVLGVYFHHCALAMSCLQLARAGLFLAANGRDPISGQRVMPEARCGSR
jgi:glutaminase